MVNQSSLAMTPASNADSSLVSSGADPAGWLLPPEREAYDKFAATRGKGGAKTYPLAPETNAGLFNLYLAGRTLPQIQAANPQFSLGQVADAAVEGAWCRRRLEYLDTLLTGAKLRAAQVAAEGVNFVADALAAAHAKHGAALQRYLQTRDEKDLGDLEVTSFKGYRDLVELLRSLTGQDQVRKVAVSGKVEHTVALPTAPPAVSDHGARLASWAEKR